MATEKRMMFVDVFKKNLCHYCNTYMSDEPCEPGECWVHDVIAQTDTVDAVEVVRCKDCKYYYKDKIKGFICRHPELDYDIECYDHWINANPDDFCSCGERKGGGSDG